MNSPLHIALTADSEIPVPPKLYGGIERIIDLLARGLTDRGHEVTLFAHPDSRTAGNLVPWPGESSQSIAATVGNALTLRRAVNEGRFDIVHSFSRVAYLLPLLPRSIPKLMTYQRPISPRSIRMGRYLSKGVHPVNGEVPPVKGRPWKLPHYANRGKTTSSGGELASARSCFSTVRTALGKLRITGLLAQFDVARSFPQFPRPLLLQPTILTSERGTRFGIRKAPNHVPTSPFTG